MKTLEMSLLGITNDDISMKHHSVSAVLALRAELPGFKCNFLKKKNQLQASTAKEQ